MLSTTATYLSVANNIARQQETTAAEPTVATATDYYLANIGQVKSVTEFVNNYRLLSYAMKAYGLGSMTYAKGLIQDLLTQGTTSPTALANTMTDPRYRAFAKAFDFAGLGPAATAAPAATTTTVSNYVEQTLEDDQGQQNQGVELAMYFARTASSITSVYSILADPALLKVVQTAYGISPYTSQQDIDVQAGTLKKIINIGDFQDADKVQKLVSRFTAEWDAGGNNAETSPDALLLNGSSSSVGLSTDLMLSISNLKLGGL